MESKPKLHYFGLYGRAEATRLLLSHLKIDYEEATSADVFGSEEEKKQWAIEKETYEFKSVPCLEIDGHRLSESRCILRYLAAKHGLAPSDAFDVWRNESLVDHFADIESGMGKVLFSEDKQAAMKEFIETKLLHSFGVLEKRLKENSSQEYFVGNKLTISDVCWVNFFWSGFLNPSNGKEKLEQSEEILKKFPLLHNFIHKRKGDFPRLETRKPSPF